MTVIRSRQNEKTRNSHIFKSESYSLLNYPAYFDLLNLPLPNSPNGILNLLHSRIEIINPGLPLVTTERFLDSPPKSRNEAIASFMRRIGICEERGSGIDKVVFQTELYKLPAPVFETTHEHTRSILFAHQKLRDINKNDRIRACYLHACLKYVQRDFMTNSTLRKRFGISSKNSAIASRIIKTALIDGSIRCYDDSVGNKAKKYLPQWA